MKKKAELAFSPLVYAALALIILVVCIGIFYLLTKGPLKGIHGFSKKSEDQGKNAIDVLSITIGNCDPGSDRCVGNTKYICNENHVWVQTKNDC